MIDDKLKLQRSMKGGLYRAYLRKETFDYIFDIGAAKGEWALMANSFFSNAKFILFEPLEERFPILNKLSIEYGFITIKKAAGDRVGNIELYVTEDLDGTGIADNGKKSSKRIFPMTTIDEVVDEFNLKGNFLIKLDTHGFEVPILEGAKNALKNTKMLIIECYGKRIAPISLIFGEMCQKMDELGFGLIDIVDVMYREWDLSFWQCDAFFVPKTHNTFKINTYYK